MVVVVGTSAPARSGAPGRTRSVQLRVCSATHFPGFAVLPKGNEWAERECSVRPSLIGPTPSKTLQRAGRGLPDVIRVKPTMHPRRKNREFARTPAPST